MNKVKKLLVVGGGNSGFISALILKTRFPNMQVDMVYSKKIPIMGVGEGCTAHFKDFMEFVGINQFEMIAKTDATMKCSLTLKNWNKKITDLTIVHDALHSHVYGQNLIVWMNKIAKNLPITSKMQLERCNKFIKKHLSNGYVPVNQFHFDTFKLNSFFEEICIKKNIGIIHDELLDVQFNEEGYIARVTGVDASYEYDFYIDSTGNRRFLIDKMGSKWKTFGDCIKVNSAYVFQTDVEEKIPTGTTITGMNCGWLFHIPVFSHTGNGYIYDDNYITDEQAKQEIEQFFGKKIDNGRVIKFTTGYSEKTWIKNCCAVGLSSIFMDPIGASNIGTTIQQTFLLMHRLLNYDENIIYSYNDTISVIHQNTLDFVVLHYLNGRTDTKFWKDVQSMNKPKSLENKLKIWRNKTPIADDLRGTNFMMNAANFFVILLYIFEFLDTESIKYEYDSFPDHIKEQVEQIISSQETEIAQDTVSHNEALEYIRKLYIS